MTPRRRLLSLCLQRRPFCLAMLLAPLYVLAAFGQDEKLKGPERWRDAIQKFEQLDRENAPPQGAALFVGSSSIRRWKLDDSFPDLSVINRGFGGSEIADSIHYLDQLVLRHKPSVVVLYAGDNDISRGKTAQQVATDFRTFARKTTERLPQTTILFIAIKPSIKRWELADEMQQANRMIAAHCKQNDRLKFIDVFPPMLGEDGRPNADLFADDGLHLNDAGYRLWASLLRPHLKKTPANPPQPARDS